jgi:uncharacterized protein (TIGR02271 family)
MNERKNTKTEKKTGQDRNPDPITGEPGSHPVGTAAGAVAGGAAGVGAGAAAGAALGTATSGPIGAAVGGAIGAVAGAAGGKAVAERVDPTAEEAYWREQYVREPYYDKNYSYEDYRNAYRAGYEGYSRLGGSGRSFEEFEPQLRGDYERSASKSKLRWEDARHAARAAWNRFDRRLERYLDYDVVDRDDTKIGTLQCLWSDHTGEPAFIGVRTGWIFGKTHVVPAQSVQVSEGNRRIRLPYTSEKVKDAPSYDAEAEMSDEKEREVYQYYAVRTQSQQMPQRAASQAVQGKCQPQERASTEKTAATPEQATIQLSEEQVKIGKREVEAGGVRLRKIVRTEVVNQPVEVQREELVIERVPAEEAHSGRQQAFKEQEVYIPLRREEVIVQKESRLREEVRARKRRQTEHQEVSEQVRKEDVEIEETGEARRTGKPGEPAGDRMRQREEQPRSRRRHED